LSRLGYGVDAHGALAEIAQLQAAGDAVGDFFAHASRDPGHHPHRRDLAAAKELMPNLQVATFYEAPNGSVNDAAGIHEGRMQAAKLPQWDHQEADVYMCGPLGFMQEQWLGLVKAGVPAVRLHREVFGPEMLDYLS